MMQDTKMLFEYTIGSKSHMNLLGKILFSPLIVLIVFVWAVMEILFLKRKD